jgi:hypothetical protein
MGLKGNARVILSFTIIESHNEHSGLGNSIEISSNCCMVPFWARDFAETAAAIKATASGAIIKDFMLRFVATLRYYL